MHAIQRYHYDRLQEYLHLLKKESEVFELPGDHQNAIIEQEKILIKLYNNYQEALLEVANLIKQYDQEHKSIRRLLFIHKQYRKSLQIKKNGKEIF